MAAWTLKLTGATPDAVFVAIEVPHGPVVESLMERGFRVHAINPKQLDRFRDRFSPAGAKDPTVVELREWSRIADNLRAERNRLRNRVRELLWRNYPQFLELTDDIAVGWFLDLWRLIPTQGTAA